MQSALSSYTHLVYALVRQLMVKNERAFQDQVRGRYTYWVIWAELLKRIFKEDIKRCHVKYYIYIFRLAPSGSPLFGEGNHDQ